VISAEPAPGADPLAGTGRRTRADTGAGRHASVASAMNGPAGLTKGTAPAAAVTGTRRTRAVVPRGDPAAGMIVISAMQDGDRGAAHWMIPPGAAVEGPRSGLPVPSGVMMIVLSGVTTARRRSGVLAGARLLSGVMVTVLSGVMMSVLSGVMTSVLSGVTTA
jgi:hypothetical protein